MVYASVAVVSRPSLLALIAVGAPGVSGCYNAAMTPSMAASRPRQSTRQPSAFPGARCSTSPWIPAPV